MSDQLNSPQAVAEGLAQPLHVPIKRRSFFMYAGATAGATALVLSGCKDDNNDIQPAAVQGNSTTASGAISLGAGDVGVLNYAYALEQLEADFYMRAAAANVLTGAEQAYFQEVMKHEAIHRDFFKAALGRDAAGQVLRDLTPIYPAGTFATRTSILTTARTFEDLGVAAYNGAGKLIKKADYLVIAGQIVSVEARHAAYIRELIAPGSFAADDVVKPSNGLDGALAPADVLAAAQSFITEKLDGSSVGI